MDRNIWHGDHVELSANTQSAVAKRIKTRRIEKGLSLQAVAEVSGISKSTLQRYETGGIRNIPLHRLEGLAKALGTSKEWILGFTADAEDIVPLDADFIRFLSDLGISINSYNLAGKSIYIWADGTGIAPITREEYLQLRDTISSYARFAALNLLTEATKRDDVRIAQELESVTQLYDD